MKKVFLTLVVGLGLMLTSCASKEQKAIDIVKDATEQIKNASSAEEIEEIAEKMKKEGEALGLSDEEQEALSKNKEMQQAITEMTSATVAKALELQ